MSRTVLQRKTEMVSVKLHADTRHWADRVAQTNHRSLSGQISAWVEDARKAEKRKKGKK